MALRIVPIALCFAAVACRPQPSTTSTPVPTTKSIVAAPIEPPPLAAGTKLVVTPGATVWLDSSDARPLQLPDAGALAVRVLGNAGDRIEVELDTDSPCISPLRDLRLRLFVLRPDLREPPAQCEEIANEREVPTSAQHPTLIVRGGAQVFWRDGEPAGTVARDSTFAAPFAVAGARTCVPFALAPGDEITLCFAAEAIAQLRTPDAPLSTPNGIRGHDFDGGSALGSLGGLGGNFGGLGTRRGEAGIGSAPSSTASVRPAKPDVVGPLDKDIVRRIVRAHLNELRFCYTKALVRNPKTSGKVTIGFTIDHEGSVVEAMPKSSTVGDDELVTCMAARVVRWKFPKPAGAGTVKVTYPFVLATK